MALLINDTYTGGPEDLADHAPDTLNIGAYQFVDAGGTNIRVTGGAAVPQSNSDYFDPGCFLYSVFNTGQTFELRADDGVGGILLPLRYDRVTGESVYVTLAGGTVALKTDPGAVTLASASLAQAGPEDMTIAVVDDGVTITVTKNGATLISYGITDIAAYGMAGFQFIGDTPAPYSYGENKVYQYTLTGSVVPREVDLIVDLSQPLVIFQDDMVDSDGAILTQHTQEADRYKKGWATVAGSFEVRSAALVPLTTPVSQAYFMAEPEGRFEFNMNYDPSVGAYVNTLLRYDPATDSGISVGFNGSTVTCVSFVAGGALETSLALGQFAGTAATYAIRIDIDGDTFTVYVDGVRVAQFVSDFNAAQSGAGFVFAGGAFGTNTVSAIKFTYLPVWFAEPYHAQIVPTVLPEHIGAKYLTARDVAEGDELNNWGKLAAIIGERAQLLENDMIYAWKQTSVAYAAGVALDAVGYDYGEARGGRTDEAYRLGIYARIIANNSSGDSPSLYGILRALIPDAEGYEITRLGANITVSINGGTYDGAYILSVLRDAKAEGVGLYAIAAPERPLAFAMSDERMQSATGETAAGVGTTYIFEDAAGGFIAAGVETGDVLMITDDAAYYIVGVRSDTELQLDTTVALGLTGVDYYIAVQTIGLGFDEGAFADTI